MATITKTLGTASRDYSTIASWEADLDTASIYSNGDVADAQMYADSDFDLAGTRVDFTEGDDIGGVGDALAGIVMRAASGEETDGTIGGGGVLIESSSSIGGSRGNLDWQIAIGVTFSGLAMDASNNTETLYVRWATSPPDGDVHWDRCLVWDADHTVTPTPMLSTSSNSDDIVNCFGVAAARVQTDNSDPRSLVCNVTLYRDSDEGPIARSAVRYAQAINCIAAGFGGLSGHYDYRNMPSGCSNNISEDTTAPGSDSHTSEDPDSLFVSTVLGSEDLHLDSGATNAIDGGTDLGTSPTNVNIDIDGRDRDTEGDTWDIGADEFVAAGGGRTTKNRHETHLGVMHGTWLRQGWSP